MPESEQLLADRNRARIAVSSRPTPDDGGFVLTISLLWVMWSCAKPDPMKTPLLAPMTTSKKTLPIGLHLAFTYEPETGEIRHAFDKSSNALKGQIAGYVHESGYRLLWHGGKEYRANRIAWFLGTGIDPADLEVDHKSGDKLDNSLSNLRPLKGKANTRARKQINHKNRTSKHRGVVLDKRTGKWTVRVYADGVKHYGGSFSDELEAARVAVLYGHALHGEYNAYQMP